MGTLHFLEALRARNGGCSDYRLAKIIGCHQQSISRWRQGKETLGDSMAIRFAELLEIDPAVILASVHGERAKSDRERLAWAHIVEHFINTGRHAARPFPRDIPPY